MRTSRQQQIRKKQVQQRACRALCCSCSCRLSVSSSNSEQLESTSSRNSDRYASISSLSHAMVQERLEQMIRERQEEAEASSSSRHVDHHHHQRRKQRAGGDNQDGVHGGTKFVVMVAMEKCSYDPREDFRESMAEMIMANRLEDPKDLRSLLNYYVSMNSEEYRGIILEVFHEVCSDLFLCRFH